MNTFHLNAHLSGFIQVQDSEIFRTILKMKSNKSFFLDLTRISQGVKEIRFFGLDSDFSMVWRF
jgi:hypothetical protein